MVDTAQGTHVGLLGIADADSILEDLCDIGLLSASHDRRIRCSQGCGLRDRRLCAAAGCVLLTCNKFNRIGGLCSATDQTGKGCLGIALVEEHTGVVKDTKTCSKYVSHRLKPPYVACSCACRRV